MGVPTYYGGIGEYHFVDGRSGAIETKLYSSTSQIVLLLHRFLIQVQASDWVVRCIVLDSPSVHTSDRMEALCDIWGVAIELSSARASEENAVAERAVREHAPIDAPIEDPADAVSGKSKGKAKADGDQPAKPIKDYDNQPAGRVAESRGSLQAKSKHMDLRVYFLRQKIEDDEIAIKWCETSKMIADLGTKLLPEDRFNRLYDQLID